MIAVSSSASRTARAVLGPDLAAQQVLGAIRAPESVRTSQIGSAPSGRPSATRPRRVSMHSTTTATGTCCRPT